MPCVVFAMALYAGKKTLAQAVQEKQALENKNQAADQGNPNLGGRGERGSRPVMAKAGKGQSAITDTRIIQQGLKLKIFLTDPPQ